jgi:hypothetical protein
MPVPVALAAVMLLTACSGSFAGSAANAPTGTSASSTAAATSNAAPTTSASSTTRTTTAPATPSYAATWTAGSTSGWLGAGDWKTVNGMLVDDGSGEYSSFKPIFAPYTSPSSDYAVEAQIRISANKEGSSFGLVARADSNGGGYAGGVGSGWDRTTGINDLTGGWGSNDLNGRLVQGTAFDPGKD